MTTQHGLRNLAATLAALLAAACSDGNDPMAKPPASATLRGAITGFDGGLQVNGVAFRTAGAQLRLPDDSGAPITLESEDAVRGHLDDGMVVTVRGAIDDDGGTGEAVEIEFHDQMEGTIDDKAPGRIRVLGADVSIDDSTEIVDRHGDPLTSDDLQPDDRVEISGHGDGRGGLRATFVRVRDDVAPELEREAKGYVTAISGAILDLAFTRGGPTALRVDLSGVADAPAIAVGDLVEVKTMGPPGVDGVLVAVAIHLEDELEAEPQDEVEVEGIVTAVDATGFDLGGQRVELEPGAILLGGTVDDLVPGVKVEAEGTLGDDGILRAHKVKFQASARIDANLEAVDEAGATLTLLGITVHVTPSTELRSFAALGDLAADDRIEVRGYPTRDGLGLNATRIELVDTSPNDRAFLRAVVTAKVPTTGLTMMGLAIDTSVASFKDLSDAEMAAADFFAAITEGQTIVKVRWRNPYPTSTAQAVDEAELEN